MSNVCALYSQPYLDKVLKCYKNIVTINKMPNGPLANYVTKTNFLQLSTFKINGPCIDIDRCGLVIRSIDFGKNKCCEYLTTDEVPDLFGFLIENGYTIETEIMKMLNTSNLLFNANNDRQLICMINYKG